MKPIRVLNTIAFAVYNMILTHTHTHMECNCVLRKHERSYIVHRRHFAAKCTYDHRTNKQWKKQKYTHRNERHGPNKGGGRWGVGGTELDNKNNNKQVTLTYSIDTVYLPSSWRFYLPHLFVLWGSLCFFFLFFRCAPSQCVICNWSSSKRI